MLEVFLFLIKNAPTLIDSTVALYNKVKDDMSETDQSAIDQALADAQAADVTASASADAALDEAAKS